MSGNGPDGTDIYVRRTTYAALRKLREDLGYPTFDMLIRQLIEHKYPGRSET